MYRTPLGIATAVIVLASLLPALAQRPGPPLGGAFRRPPAAREVDPTVPRRSASETRKRQHGLIHNADLEIANPRETRHRSVSKSTERFPLQLPRQPDDRSHRLGRAFCVGEETLDGDGVRQARLTYTVRDLPAESGRWYRFHNAVWRKKSFPPPRSNSISKRNSSPTTARTRSTPSHRISTDRLSKCATTFQAARRRSGNRDMARLTRWSFARRFRKSTRCDLPSASATATGRPTRRIPD